MYKTLIILTLFISFHAYSECIFGLGQLEKTKREKAGSYYKRFDPYVRGEVNAPTKDLLYAMFLGYEANVHLSWANYTELERKIDQVPGENSYSSPTLENLRPTFYKFLTLHGALDIAKTDEIVKDKFTNIEALFSEITNGVKYEVVSPEWKLLSQEEYNSIFPESEDKSTHFMNSDCGRITNIDLGNVTFYSNKENEDQDMHEIIDENRDFLEFMQGVLPHSSYLKSQILDFLSKWPSSAE